VSSDGVEAVASDWAMVSPRFSIWSTAVRDCRCAANTTTMIMSVMTTLPKVSMKRVCMRMFFAAARMRTGSGAGGFIVPAPRPRDRARPRAAEGSRRPSR
jgi:hypothetical protein